RELQGQGLAPDATGRVGLDSVTPLHPDMDVQLIDTPAPDLALDPAPVPPSQAPESAGEELMEVFLEESSDIVESAAAALARWQADPR
ncbi:hypothetical protein ABS198_21235, partial [Acinetobacter baumannii]